MSIFGIEFQQAADYLQFRALLFLICAWIFVMIREYLVKYRHMGRLSGRIIFLRLAAVLLLFWVFFQPDFPKRTETGRKRQVAVLIDTSTSMSVADPENRFTKMKKFLTGRVLDKLKEKYDLKFFGFDSLTYQADLAGLLKKQPTGQSTDIGTALSEVNRMSGADTAGIVLVTDGAHNAESDPVSSASLLGKPVVCVGVGGPEPRQDIEVMNVDAGEFAFRNMPAVIKVNARADRLKGETATVLLKQENKVVDRKKIEIDQDNFRGTVEFTLTPKKLGSYKYTVEIPETGKEFLLENNRQDFSMQVVREKMRVLFICGQPGYEYRFLRRSLLADPGVEVVTFIILRNPDSLLFVPDNQVTLIPFPVQELFGPKLQDFDLLVFENFRYDRFAGFMPMPLLDNVRNYVASGGAFLMLGGEDSFGPGNYAGTALEELLPLAMSSGNNDLKTGLFRVSVKNLNHPIMRIGLTAEETKKLWQEMPCLGNYNQTGSPKPGSVVLADIESPESPLFVVWQFGRGRVMSSATNTTWRWSMGLAREGKGTYSYDRFWLSAVRWLINAPEPRQVQIKTDKKVYQQGANIKLSVKVLDQYYRPESDSQVNIQMQEPKGKIIDLGTPVSSGENTADRSGEYELFVNARDAGKYLFIARAVKDKKLLGENRTETEVVRPIFEFQEAFQHRDLLKQIAAKTRGSYSQIDDVKELVIPVQKSVMPVSRKIDLWDNAVVMLLFAGLLGTEWYLRRRAGIW